MERKQIEEALRKSYEKHGKVFRESPLIVALNTIEDGRFIEVNETYERVTGWKRDELIGRTSLDAGIWVDTNQRDEVKRQLSDRGTIRDFEFRFRTRAGDVRTALLSAELIEINGEPCMISMAVDITERKLADAALRESEERFRLAMNNVASGLYTLDSQGLVTYVNPAAEAIFGWTEAELLGKKMHDVTHYKHPDGTPFPASDCPGLRVLQDSIELQEYEDVFIRKDGRFFPVVYSASPLRADGKIVGIVVGFRDDTYRRQADRIVRESEERFRLVADTAPVTIWMTDIDNACIYVNRRWVEVTGRPLEAHLGNGWAESIHPDEVVRCLEIFTAAGERRQPFRMEYRLRRYDGEYIWITDSGVPRLNADGTFAGYIGSAVDVTEIKAAEDVLSTMSQKLIDAHEKERARIARELHDDVGQRLALVALRLEGIKRALPVSQTAMTEEIQQTRQQVEYLASDVQSLSHNLHPSKPKYLGLARSSESLCEELSGQGVQIEFRSENIPTDLPEEVSLCLYRVLQESLQNAIKHSGSGRFEVVLIGGSNEIRLSVRDSGIGFDPTQAMKGRGIGLSSMKERLKLVNGSIVIDSQPNHGTTVRARVPLTQPLRDPR
jgi:PAS domain S-box-containing protein